VKLNRSITGYPVTLLLVPVPEESARVWGSQGNDRVTILEMEPGKCGNVDGQGKAILAVLVEYFQLNSENYTKKILHATRVEYSQH
jgi:hypothetical protein